MPESLDNATRGRTWIFLCNRRTLAYSQTGLIEKDQILRTTDGHVQITLRDGIQLNRAPFSYEPVFLFHHEYFLIAASHYLILLSELKQRGIELQVDLGYMADYLRYPCPWTHSTLCRQIQIVRNGENIRVPTAGSPVRHLLPLRTAPCSPPDIEGYLIQELQRPDLDNTAFHISSGLDASLLVILAAKMASEKRITAVSCDTSGAGVSDELCLVRQLKQDVGFQLQLFDFTRMDIIQSGDHLLHNCLGYPIAHPSHLVEYWLDKQVAENYRVIVSGRGPDECLGGYPWHLPQYQDKTAYLNRLRILSDEQLQQLFRQDIELPNDPFESHLNAAYESELSLHARLEIDQRTIAEAWGVIHSGLELGLNIRILKPFQNCNLARALFNLDEQYMVNGTNQKVYLRESMASHYPHYLLQAPKRGLRLDLKPYLEKATEVLDQIQNSEFAAQFLNPSYVEMMYQSTIEGKHNYGWQIWSLLLLAKATDRISR